MSEILEEIKFHTMSRQDLVLSLDRLTRFKYPAFKYYRVFNEILSKYLISPKLSRAKIEKLDIKTYISYVETIWNASVNVEIGQISSDNKINRLITAEEMSFYNLNDELTALINANLDYESVLKLISPCGTTPLNLKRLILYKNGDFEPQKLRERYNLKFPVEKVVLCEGITEEILLPAFAAAYGYNFDKFGVHLISAGGKNQVAKLYCELKDELKLPIFVLLDADAQKTAETINGMLRNSDKIHLIHHGEFEDLFSLFLIKRTINNRYKNILQCAVSDFKSDKPMTKILADYFRINNLGDFQKAEFAKEILKNIKGEADLTEEIRAIIAEIKKCGANC